MHITTAYYHGHLKVDKKSAKGNVNSVKRERAARIYELQDRKNWKIHIKLPILQKERRKQVKRLDGARTGAHGPCKNSTEVVDFLNDSTEYYQCDDSMIVADV
jgi:hypothetical protein